MLMGARVNMECAFNSGTLLFSSRRSGDCSFMGFGVNIHCTNNAGVSFTSADSFRLNININQ